MIDISKQKCDYSVFDRYSGYHECHTKTDLTVLITLNPLDQELDVNFLCQTHSDSSLRPYVYAYEKLSSEVTQLKRTRSERMSILNKLNLEKQKTYEELVRTRNLSEEIKLITKSIDRKEQLKNKISYRMCAECRKEIAAEDARIIVSYMHPMGKDRHHVNLCSASCLEKFRKNSHIEKHRLDSLTNYV